MKVVDVSMVRSDVYRRAAPVDMERARALLAVLRSMGLTALQAVELLTYVTLAVCAQQSDPQCAGEMAARLLQVGVQKNFGGGADETGGGQ